MRLLLVGVVLLLAPSMAQGQDPGAGADAGLTVLSLPEGHAVVCQSVPAPGVIVRVFTFGNTQNGRPHFPRQVMVAFDSAGRPDLLRDLAMLAPPARMEAVTVRLSESDAAGGVHATSTLESATLARMAEVARLEGPQATDSLLPPPAVRPLTPAERMEARRLAAWLWIRRCDP